MTQSKMTPKPVLAGWKFSSRTALCTRVCIKMHLQILSPSLMPGSTRLMARVSLSQHSSYFKRGCKKKKKKLSQDGFPSEEDHSVSQEPGWASCSDAVTFGQRIHPGAGWSAFTPSFSCTHVHKPQHRALCSHSTSEIPCT